MKPLADFTLGIDSYGSDFNASDGHGLNLAWTSDERFLLDVDVMEVLSDQVREELEEGLPALRRYAVDDPYGGYALQDAASFFFDIELSSRQIFCGSGVNGLLYALSHLAIRGLCCIGPSYVDLPTWIARRGVPVVVDKLGINAASDLYLLENPNLFADFDIDNINETCLRARELNAVVIVDESNANYIFAEKSCVRFVNACDNLVILRGFSKAYGLGALRTGVAICSPALRTRIMSVLPALSVSPLSLRLAAEIWRMGDINHRLQETIASYKPRMKALLGSQGIECISFENKVLPYVFIEPSRIHVSSLEAAGIRGKLHKSFSGLSCYEEVLRLSLPLLSKRVEIFEGLIL